MPEFDWNKYEGLFPRTLSERERDPDFKTIKGAIRVLAQCQLSIISSGQILRCKPEHELRQKHIYNMFRHELEQENNGTIRVVMDSCEEVMVEMDRMALEIARKEEMLWSSLAFLEKVCTAADKGPSVNEGPPL
jgi:hypothetical protein